MKASGKSVALAVAGGVLAVGVLAAPATAHNAPVLAADTATVTTHTRGDGTQPPAELGDPAEWGVVKFTVGSTGGFKPQTVLDIGGGTWSYGKILNGDGQNCYSNYYHPKVMHGSTAKVSKQSQKAVEFAGKWAKASVTAGAALVCETYYAKY
ncbi:lactococcin 972 family bacteriocin [Streptomyces coeruleorubidus]|jgi:lactococcin 972 family bacteriocin|uniref:lactococcin 972 family bacteriocin n=1 Tax=Streptomyces coeruleorubidus TaxID=116188 RepID=UPI0033AE0B7B